MLTGGELAAAVMADAIVRIIPGVISDEQSALSDSFQDNLFGCSSLYKTCRLQWLESSGNFIVRA